MENMEKNKAEQRQPDGKRLSCTAVAKIVIQPHKQVLHQSTSPFEPWVPSYFN